MTTRRVLDTVVRSKAVTLAVDGTIIEAYEGETLATVLLVIGKQGADWSLFCNMGACYACMVDVADNADGPYRPVPACLSEVKEGLFVRTGGRP